MVSVSSGTEAEERQRGGMAAFVLKKGLDLPVQGAPDQAVDPARPPASVAVIGSDFVGLKPRMLVEEGDSVLRGAPLFCHKDAPDVMFTAPATGRVRAINRGARRVLQSVVIDVSAPDDPGQDFGAVDPAGATRADIAGRLAASGLWTAFRTRPYSKVPAADAVPAAIFVTAIDTDPLCPDPAPIIAAAGPDFAAGLAALTRLTEGPVHLCQAPDAEVGAPLPERVEAHTFAGPHPAGLAGTHVHFLERVTPERMVWTIGYQDVIAIGALMRTGHLDTTRIVALSGPRARRPRLVRTMLGAATDELVANESDGDAPLRVISGSILNGRLAAGAFAWLGRFHRQVTLMTEDRSQQPLGWIRPQPDRFAAQPVLASAWRGAGRLFDLTSNLNGGRRAMVPIGTFEHLMPQDYLPTQLLRALIVMDTDTAQALGALELDEEDLALCTFACPAKYEYGDALRDSLARIEKEG